MAISSDYGDSTNVHTIKKKQIGDRLALLVLKYTYEKSINANGPSALKATQKNNAILISFSNAKQLSTTNKKELIGFELVTEKESGLKVVPQL